MSDRRQLSFMFYYAGDPEIEGSYHLRSGTYWRRKGERMEWELLDWDENNVRVRGPGDCKAAMTVDRGIFQRDFVRA